MSKPWIKLWARWYESSSHALLSPEALHTGPHLLVLAGKYGRQEDGSALLVGPQGEPLSIAELARMTRWTSAKMARILGELRQCGTMTASGAALCFPRFDRWQESSSAARVRRHRARDVTVDVTPSKRSKTEDRRQRTEDRPSDPPSGLAPVPDSPAEREEVALARLREGLTWVRRPSGCNALLLPDAKLRELLRAGASVDDVIETVGAFADAIDRGEEKRSDWRAHYVLSFGWFERIRATHVLRGRAPQQVDTIEQALDVETRTGVLPAGWQRVAGGVVGPGGKLHEVESRA